jgi:hypothetical protein
LHELGWDVFEMDHNTFHLVFATFEADLAYGQFDQGAFS